MAPGFPMNVQQGDARRVLGIQGLLRVLVGGVFWLSGGMAQGQAALYGGGCALVSTWLLARRVRLAIDMARVSPGSETGVLLLGAIQRFALVLGLFVLGMGWIDLSPVPLVVGFAVAQAAFFLHGTVPRANRLITGRACKGE